MIVFFSADKQGMIRRCLTRYAAVPQETVRILFQPPPWQYEQIGIVKSQGAQVASDATVYSELQGPGR
jgi:hypothetical protein